MLQIDKLHSKRLANAARAKVLTYMKENRLFVPDRNWILSLLLPDAPLSVLDIGPNVYLFENLVDPAQRKRYSYTALDVQKRYQDPSVTQVVHDANCAPYPFPDSSFDLIIASDVIEHLRETGAFLSEVNRLLKPGGELFLTTPNYANLFCIVKVIRGRMFHNPLGRDADRYCFEEHLRFFTHRDLVPYLARFGLHARHIITSDLKTDIDFALKHGLWGRGVTFVFNMLSRLSYRLSPEIILVASKSPGVARFIRAR